MPPLASWSCCIDSSAGAASARSWALIDSRSRASCGLRLCGMVELPTVPSGMGSNASPNSGCIIE